MFCQGPFWKLEFSNIFLFSLSFFLIWRGKLCPWRDCFSFTHLYSVGVYFHVCCCSLSCKKGEGEKGRFEALSTPHSLLCDGLRANGRRSWGPATVTCCCGWRRGNWVHSDLCLVPSCFLVKVVTWQGTPRAVKIV